MENKTTIIQSAQKDEFLSNAMAVDAIVGQQRLIKDVMKNVMVLDTHYGTIPGCPKPSLWKAGAEVICMTFRLAPDFTSEVLMDGKHMTVRCVCRLTHIPTGKVFGSAEAICSTKEKKYRVRKDGGKIVENGNLEDSYNTIIKMANKRALVAAVLIVTAASDILTQDMGEEVYVENEDDNAASKPAKEDPKKEQPGEKGEAPAAQQQDEKPASKNGKQKWSGLIDRCDVLELPDGKPAWALHGEGGITFKTADEKLIEQGVEKGVKYDVTYEVNYRGTNVATKIKEAKA